MLTDIYINKQAYEDIEKYWRMTEYKESDKYILEWWPIGAVALYFRIMEQGY